MQIAVDGDKVPIEYSSKGGRIGERSPECRRIRTICEGAGCASDNAVWRLNSAHMNNVPEVGSPVRVCGTKIVAWASVLSPERVRCSARGLTPPCRGYADLRRQG